MRIATLETQEVMLQTVIEVAIAARSCASQLSLAALTPEKLADCVGDTLLVSFAGIGIDIAVQKAAKEPFRFRFAGLETTVLPIHNRIFQAAEEQKASRAPASVLGFLHSASSSHSFRDAIQSNYYRPNGRRESNVMATEEPSWPQYGAHLKAQCTVLDIERLDRVVCSKIKAVVVL
jgi:hypothetical protein